MRFKNLLIVIAIAIFCFTGFQVELKIEGLGQIPAIRNLFLEHILAARNSK